MWNNKFFRYQWMFTEFQWMWICFWAFFSSSSSRIYRSPFCLNNFCGFLFGHGTIVTTTNAFMSALVWQLVLWIALSVILQTRTYTQFPQLNTVNRLVLITAIHLINTLNCIFVDSACFDKYFNHNNSMPFQTVWKNALTNWINYFCFFSRFEMSWIWYFIARGGHEINYQIKLLNRIYSATNW